MRISDWSSDVCSSDRGQDQALALDLQRLGARRKRLADHVGPPVEHEVHAAGLRSPEAAHDDVERLADRLGPRTVTRQRSSRHGHRVRPPPVPGATPTCRSEEHTSELKSLMRISYAAFCLKK